MRKPSVFDPDLIAQNSAHVASMPDWMKGSPVNERKTEAQLAWERINSALDAWNLAHGRTRKAGKS